MGIDELKATVKRRRVTVRVLLDNALLEQHAALSAELDRVVVEDSNLNRIPQQFALTDQVLAAEQAITDAEVEFTFEGIGNARWLDLVAQHPPTDEDRAEGSPFHGREFPAAAVAATCETPELSFEDALWLVDELDQATWTQIWQACLLANLGDTTRPKSLTASVAARLRDASSTTASLAESLAAPS